MISLLKIEVVLGTGMPLRRIAMVTPSLAPLVKKQFIFARRKIKLDYSKGWEIFCLY